MERAKQLDPSSATARLGLVWIHALRLRCAEALAEFAALAELGPLDFDRALALVPDALFDVGPRQGGPPAPGAAPGRPGRPRGPPDAGRGLPEARSAGRSALEVLAALGESDPDALALRARLAVERGDLDGGRGDAIARPGRPPRAWPSCAGELALMRSRRTGRRWTGFAGPWPSQPDRRRRLDGLVPGPAAIGPGAGDPSRCSHGSGCWTS